MPITNKQEIPFFAKGYFLLIGGFTLLTIGIIGAIQMQLGTLIFGFILGIITIVQAIRRYNKYQKRLIQNGNSNNL